MDRRVKYTRMVLNESLIKLLEQKEITKITVKELCADADVNRSTYYAHFTDPFDQLSQLKEGLLREVTEYAQKIDTEQLPNGQRQYLVLKNVLQYIEGKRHIFQILLGKSGDRDLQERILHILGEKAFPEDTENHRSEEERSYLLLYACNGCFGMFIHWLMSEEPIPSAKLAHMMADFTRNVRI